MYSSVKKRYGILFFTLVIFIILNFCWATLAQSAEPDSQNNKTATSTEEKTNTESQSGSPAIEIPKEPAKIEQVGEKVGQQIDFFSEQASLHIGPWVNAKVVYGITWLKLILCLVLLLTDV